MPSLDAAGAVSRTTWNLRRHALCGIEGPILFSVMFVIEGFLVRGYDLVSQAISDLGAFSLYGSHAILQTLNFFFFGILVLTLAVGLGLALPRSGAVTNSLALFGVLTFAAGLFADKPSPYPAYVHDFVSIVAFVVVILAQFSLWNRLRRSIGEEKTVWGRYGLYSLISGILSLALLLVFVTGFPGSSFTGLTERVFLAVPLLWIEVVSIALYRSQSKPVPLR